MESGNGSARARAKALRSSMTDAEKLLWSHLRAGQLEGAKFVRQHPVGPYIVDFAARSVRLIVEVDGGQHGTEADAARTAHLHASGYQVTRFWNHDVLGNIEGVLETIRRELASARGFLP